MNAEQFIEENYFWLKIDCPRDIQIIYQALEDYHKEQLHIGAVSNSEVFEHYGKPFTSGRDLWDFITANYNFTPKTSNR